MVRLAVTPATFPPSLKLPVVPVAPAPTPRTMFESVVVTTAPAATGAAPPTQFEPTVQSLLVAPVQPCAAADRGDSAASAATEALIKSRRSKRARMRDEDRVRRGVKRGLSF